MKVIIMRGLPGSGKSTLIESMSSPVVCSADHFFINEDGEYKFNAKLLGLAHESCKAAFSGALHDKAPLVVVDNTNTQLWEYEWYLELASDFGYQVSVVTVGDVKEESLAVYAKRNSHGVPLAAIKRMAARFE